jgi:Icc-related predicted phosphoesterase
MRIAVFSDIHGNLPALEAVLADIHRQSVDAVYCLGDLVGYAPFPNEVTERIRREQKTRDSSRGVRSSDVLRGAREQFARGTAASCVPVVS